MTEKKTSEDEVEDYDDDDSPWETLDKALQYAEEIEEKINGSGRIST